MWLGGVGCRGAAQCGPSLYPLGGPLILPSQTRTPRARTTLTTLTWLPIPPRLDWPFATPAPKQCIPAKNTNKGPFKSQLETAPTKTFYHGNNLPNVAAASFDTFPRYRESFSRLLGKSATGRPLAPRNLPPTMSVITSTYSCRNIYAPQSPKLAKTAWLGKKGWKKPDARVSPPISE